MSNKIYIIDFYKLELQIILCLASQGIDNIY